MENLNMADMFGRMAEMQEKMKASQEALAQKTVTAEAGGGMVKVTANGKMQITGIKIDPDAVDVNDMELLEDLVVAGVNKALEEAGKMAQADMMNASGLGGLDLGALGLDKFGL
jgi:DNA-binding YbaB/EbfC family protein